MRRFAPRWRTSSRGTAAAKALGCSLGCAVASLGDPVSSGAVAAGRSVPVECRAEPARGDALSHLGPRGEIRLASGARAVLGGLGWPEDPALVRDAEAWLQRQRGRPLLVTQRGEPDRWGRIRIDAEIVPDPGSPEGLASEGLASEGLASNGADDLAAGLIQAGLAPVDSGEGDILCRPGLLLVEAGARAAQRGIWARPLPEARDAAGLEARVGRFAVIEGRVLHVGERAARVYLDFARRGEAGLTVIVPKRTWRRMAERGLSAVTLQGRRVRVRGLLEIRRGPVLEIASAEMIEALDEPTMAEGALRR